MTPPIPRRYRLEVRLGRDEDVEEWFATDLELDRPVLIRVIGPEATRARGRSFLASVRRASRASHTHVAAVFAADKVPGSTYAVTEWVGGTTLADRTGAGDGPPLAELLTNACGLAEGLSVLHGAGVTHGAIDDRAILYSRGQPAKLGGFGRVPRGTSPADDVRALAGTLETALTGKPPGTMAPSELIHSLSPSVDDILRSARADEIDARQLADRLRAVPYSPPVSVSFRWSWRRLIPAALLALAAAVLVWAGSAVDTSPTPPLQVAALPLPTLAARPDAENPPAQASSPGEEAPEQVVPQSDPVVLLQVLDFDPLGDGEEHPGRLPLLTDGDPNTEWRTERYFDPLPLLKEGVGLAFEVSGSPAFLELTGLSEGTAFRLMWAESLLGVDDPGWEVIAEQQAGAATLRLPLPEHRSGVWLLWLTDLPPEGDGYRTRLAEVSFSS